MSKRVIGTLLGGLLLLVGGIAYAAEGVDRPTVTDDTVSDEPTSTDQVQSDDQSTESDDEATESDASETSDSSDLAVHPDNHGADVSSAAQTCPTGQDAIDQGTTHGECVSAVAQDNQGHTEGQSHSQGKGKSGN